MKTPKAKIGDIVLVKNETGNFYQAIITVARYSSPNWFYIVDRDFLTEKEDMISDKNIIKILN